MYLPRLEKRNTVRLTEKQLEMDDFQKFSRLTTAATQCVLNASKN